VAGWVQTSVGNGNAYLFTVVSNANTYAVTTIATGGDKFSINRASTGALTRTCTPPSTGGCNSSGSCSRDSALDGCRAQALKR
jgi:hypothetical protein